MYLKLNFPLKYLAKMMMGIKTALIHAASDQWYLLTVIVDDIKLYIARNREIMMNVRRLLADLNIFSWCG